MESRIEISIEPLGETLECNPGETVMDCAVRHGLRWPTICRGAAQCSACRFEILEGEDNLESEPAREEHLFRAVDRTAKSGLRVRFGCCAVPTGPVRLFCRQARRLQTQAG